MPCSAGACPPRSLALREKCTQPQAVSLSIEARRGTGPRPTVKGRFWIPSRGGLSPAIARPTRKTHADQCRFPLGRGTARDRPSPYGERGGFGYRRAGACPPRSVHGAGNPLACACGIRGPSPYGERAVLDTVARGTGPRDRPTRAKTARGPMPFPARSVHGEGQALALR